MLRVAALVRRAPAALQGPAPVFCRSAYSSSVPGINVTKDGADPPSLADSEYPAWLWDMADKAPVRNAERLGTQDGQLFFKKTNLTSIKKGNFLRDKKR